MSLLQNVRTPAKNIMTGQFFFKRVGIREKEKEDSGYAQLGQMRVSRAEANYVVKVSSFRKIRNFRVKSSTRVTNKIFDFLN